MQNRRHEHHQPLTDIEQLISEKDALIDEKDDLIEKKSQVIEAQKHRIKVLEEGLRLLNRKHFAPSSELRKLQGDLFNEVELAASEAETTPDKSTLPKQIRTNSQIRGQNSGSKIRGQNSGSGLAFCLLFLNDSAHS